MTQNIIKKFNLNIDEEKDHFLNFLNKRVRNNRKKLDQIDELSKRDKTTLKAEQIEKINSKAEVKENIKYIDTIRLMYYEALKTARDEGKFVPGTTGESAPVTKTEESTQIATKQEEEAPVKPEVSEKERQEEIARITRENLSKVINLVHFAQFFRDQSKVQEFRQASELVSDADLVYDFYAKIFSFSESDKFVKIIDKINGSVHELENYISESEDPALRNKSYRHLQSVVENVANSSFFRNHKADVTVAQTRVQAESSAIGSELKKTHEQERIEAPVEQTQVKSSPVKTQEKLRSPEKEVRQVEPTPVQQEEARKDWGNVEDEEEEEEQYEGEEEGEEQVPEEEQKKEKTADDEWATVKPRYKEKKEEVPQRGGNRPFRGGRGGGRGGFRKPRPEGLEGEERREGEGGYQGGYRGKPRRQYGEGKEEAKEGEEGEKREYQPRREYRGGRGGQGRGEYRGQGRGQYRGGNREGGYQGGYRGPRTENTQKPQEEVERKEAPVS